MHSLAVYNKDDLFNQKSVDDLSPENQKALEEVFKNNIKKIKESGDNKFPPFYITFSHHFNNLISGHAKSFADGKGIKPGFSDVFDQTKGLDLKDSNRGLSGLAKDLIVNHLFSRDNGPRILVDTKHMSLNTRDDFYALVKNHNDSNAEDKIPIINSHAAVTGLTDRKAARELEDKNKVDKNSYVSRWDINLTGQDIEEIFITDGLIGVCMHDGRMPGGKFRKYLKRLAKMYKSKESISRAHGQMFLTNVFHIAKVNLNYIRKENRKTNDIQIKEEDAWKTLSLGSDNDGVVDPFDHFNTAAKLLDFKVRCIRSMEQNNKSFFKKFRILSLPSEKPFSEAQLKDLMQGFSPEEIADKVFYDNTDVFLSNYFTKDYLNNNL